MALDVDYADGTFSGEVLLTYENLTGAALDEVVFRLYGNAVPLYGAAFLHVVEARVDGVPVSASLSVESTVLSVPLSKPLEPDRTVDISLLFSGAAAASPAEGGFSSETEYGLLSRSAHALTLTAFYPMLAPITETGWVLRPVGTLGDPVFADCGVYDVTVRVESGVTVIPLADSTLAEPDGRTLHVFHRDALRDFPLVLVDDGREPFVATANGIVLRSWFATPHGEAATTALEKGSAAIAVFSDRFGALPLRTVDMVEVPLQRVAGVECSGLFLVSADYAAAPRERFFTVIVSHEMAHQWFYAVVGSDPVQEPWLDEALATYASYLFLAALSPEAARSEKTTWSMAYGAARSLHPELRVTSPLTDFPDPGTYSAFVYDGGALELDAIRTALGDDCFFAGLSEYYVSHALSIASGDALSATFCRVCSCATSSALFFSEAAP